MRKFLRESNLNEEGKKEFLNIIEQVNNNYSDFEEKISLMDENLRSIAAQADDKNTIVTNSSTLNFLKDYGFNVISLQDEDNLKEIRLNNIKNKFKSGKYKYILCIDKEINNDVITELVDNYKAQTIIVDSLTLSLDEDDYFNIMNKFIENIKTVLS